MKQLHAFGKLALTAAAAAALAACGGSDSTPTKAPAFKLEVTSTEAFPGTYGDVGEYETVKGTLSGEVDPADPKNAVIQDLALAPTNANGMVEYKAEFVMLKPKNMDGTCSVSF